MNVYDFDKTIYNGDASVNFYLFMLKKQPELILLAPTQVFGLIKYMLKLSTKEEFKESYFSFLKKIKNIDKQVDTFWIKEENNIKKWYLKNRNSNDVIISASPYFLLRPICQKLKVKRLIASDVNKNTGKYKGLNCHGIQKVSRYKEEFEEQVIDNFYSDSLSDRPLMDLARTAYIVKGDKITNLLDYRITIKHKLKKMFFSRSFFVFVLCGGSGTVVNFVASLIISSYLNETIAYVFGYGISIFVTYYLNIKLNFYRKISIKEFIKFCISYIPNFIILFAFVAVFLNVLNVNKIIVYGLAGLLGIPITFVLVKLFALKKENNND